MRIDRRRFLARGIFTLVGATTGSLTLSGCGADSAGSDPTSTAGNGPPPPGGPASATLGWQLDTPANGGAYAYFEVARNLTLQWIQIDSSIAPSTTTGSAGFAQATCRGWVSRGSLPSFAGAGRNAAPTPVSADFGPVVLYNPAAVNASYDPALDSNVFYSAALRSWVPMNGTDAAGAHRFAELTTLALDTGDYLVLEVDQSGIPASVYMQAVLGYS